MKPTVKIEIQGRKVSLFLLDEKKFLAGELSWIDDRDLSSKILTKLDQLLKRNGFSFSNIGSVKFNCDSPYYAKGGKVGLEDISSKDKCGFTSWQVGEITAKVLNMKV